MLPLNRIKPNGKIDLWDLGPSEPEAPIAPNPPSDDLKGAKKVVADAEFKSKAAIYEREFEAHVAASKAFVAWHDKHDGPIKVDLWTIDATHAIAADPERYVIDLPKNKKPGKAQLEQEERQRESGELQQIDRDKDPQFGKAMS